MGSFACNDHIDYHSLPTGRQCSVSTAHFEIQSMNKNLKNCSYLVYIYTHTSSRPAGVACRAFHSNASSLLLNSGLVGAQTRVCQGSLFIALLEVGRFSRWNVCSAATFPPSSTAFVFHSRVFFSTLGAILIVEEPGGFPL